MDADVQKVTVPFGILEASFTFVVRNVSREPIIITGVHATCGCTKPKLPSLPWTLNPNCSGKIDVAMHLAGKRGQVGKTLTVITNRGLKALQVLTDIQELPAGAMSPDERVRKLRIAGINRQAVLHGECASCHATPALAKMGAELYGTACTICHEADHRAPAVPDLNELKKPTDADYWRSWIGSGREGRFMPAFAIEHGGILTAAQIDSLVAYLVETFPAAHPANPGTADSPALR